MKRSAIIFLTLIFIARFSAFAEVSRFNNPDKLISVESGEVFIIELDSNRSTGYEWQIAYPLDKYAFELAGVEYARPLKASPGAGGKENWTFRALASRNGKLPIAFKYVRPWEKDLPPAKEITFSLIVNKGPEERQLEHQQKELDAIHDESLVNSAGE